MARKFEELERKMSPAALERSNAIYRELVAELPLSELRLARGLSQKMLAGVLHVDQASISKMERRTDMYISTLRSHIEAMGGKLDIVARFPEGTVKIANFNGISLPETAAMPAISL